MVHVYTIYAYVYNNIFIKIDLPSDIHAVRLRSKVDAYAAIVSSGARDYVCMGSLPRCEPDIENVITFRVAMKTIERLLGIASK